MNKKMLMWLAIGVAVYFIFLKKKATTATVAGTTVTGETPGILESSAQGVMGEIGSALGLGG